jgi:hypothetical protein
MPLQSQDIPLGAFLKALHEQKIKFILIGAMAAIEQGAPLMTVDYDFWVDLPERQYVRVLTTVQRLGGTIRARTLYELSDGTQVNAVFNPGGLRSFSFEWKHCRLGKLEGVPVRILPLRRVIASKRAANREKDIAVIPILERTLRLSKRLKSRSANRRRSASNKSHRRGR